MSLIRYTCQGAQPIRKCTKLLITIYRQSTPQRAKKSPYYSLYHEHCRIYAQTSRYIAQTGQTTFYVYASLRLAKYLGVLHGSYFLGDRNIKLLASSLGGPKTDFWVVGEHSC